MTEEEMQIIKRVQLLHPFYDLHCNKKTNKPVGWVPMAWSINLINEIREKKIKRLTS